MCQKRSPASRMSIEPAAAAAGAGVDVAPRRPQLWLGRLGHGTPGLGQPQTLRAAWSFDQPYEAAARAAVEELALAPELAGNDWRHCQAHVVGPEYLLRRHGGAGEKVASISAVLRRPPVTVPAKSMHAVRALSRKLMAARARRIPLRSHLHLCGCSRRSQAAPHPYPEAAGRRRAWSNCIGMEIKCVYLGRSKPSEPGAGHVRKLIAAALLLHAGGT
jgi:hypothetical protein